jgi:hypothetical protein
MAQKPRGHLQLTGKYSGQKTGRESNKRAKHGKSIATTSFIELKGSRQTVASFGSPLSRETDSQLPDYLTAASKAVKHAQERVRKAQQQLQEAQDVEKSMLELAQLQEVRRAHQELYGPDKQTGLTAAQQYLAFKQTLREQPKQQ